MNTVPTLCATGSILTAATIGLAFGVASPQNISITGPLTSSLPCPGTPKSGSKLSTTSSPHNTTIREPTDNPAASLALDGPLSLDTPQSRHNPSKSSIGDTESGHHSSRVTEDIKRPSTGGQLSLLGETSQSDSPAQTETHLTLRKRSSRLVKRLSNFSISVASASSSSEPSDSRPLTRSSGSSALFFSTPPSGEQLPRNKLVKRTISQRLPGGVKGQSSIRTHTIDRPATRHKRTATLSNGSWPHDAIQDHDFTPMYDDSNGILFPYFTTSTTIQLDNSPARLKLANSGIGFIRRIFPKNAASPTLCPAAAINYPHKQTCLSPRETEQAFTFSSRPTSAAGLFNFSSSGPGLDHNQNLSEADPKAREPRRSLSIGNLLSRNPTSSHRSQRRLKVQLGRRVISAPAASMVVDHISDDDGHVTKRRHVSNSLRDSPPRDTLKSSPPHELATPPTAHSLELPTSKPRTPPSNVSLSSFFRQSGHSATQSDPTSSQIGSDSEGRVFSSCDEDDARSDTAYDSMRTGTTKSSLGFRGPPLETLFDKDSPPPPIGFEDEARHLYFGSNTSPSPITTKGPSFAEEDSSTSTPGRTVTADKRESHRSSANNTVIGLPSSPPSAARPLSLGRLAWDSDAEDDGVTWSDPEDNEDDPFASSTLRQTDIQSVQARQAVKRRLQFTLPEQDENKSDAKNNLFDWSEPAAVERSSYDDEPPRPKTVHGKKNPENMAGRTGGHRAPSGLHARSQSVPVLADLLSKHNSATSKFGTWGVGSKGVTEDWNDDFEFDTGPDVRGREEQKDAQGGIIAQSVTMVVPDTIKAQQTNVLANIGLLREWGLLIEELKELRNRATVLGIKTEDFAAIFDEVDAMIDLADQEVDNKPVKSPRSPASSPGFDFEDSPSATTPRHRPIDLGNDTPVFDRTPNQSSTPQPSASTADVTTFQRRPRKDSEAVAQSVIEALQNRRHPTYLATPDQPSLKKIPFDTRTLRKIVPHVNSLVKKVKQILREAEGLNNSPKEPNRSADPALRMAFRGPTDDEDSDDSHEDDGDEEERQQHRQHQDPTITMTMSNMAIHDS